VSVPRVSSRSRRANSASVLQFIAEDGKITTPALIRRNRPSLPPSHPSLYPCFSSKLLNHKVSCPDPDCAETTNIGFRRRIADPRRAGELARVAATRESSKGGWTKESGCGCGRNVIPSLRLRLGATFLTFVRLSFEIDESAALLRRRILREGGGGAGRVQSRMHQTAE